MSFRVRLVAAAAYLVAAVVLALEIPLALNIERRADSDFQADVLARAALLSARISDDVAASGRSQAAPVSDALRGAVASTAASSGERIVVTDERGRLLVDSAGEAAPPSRFASSFRPEFASALEDGRVDFRRRFSDTLDDHGGSGTSGSGSDSTSSGPGSGDTVDNSGPGSSSSGSGSGGDD